MNIYALISLANAVYVALLLLVFIAKSKKRGFSKNLLFLLFFFGFFWMMADFKRFSIDNAEIVLWWARFKLVSAVFLMSVFLHFSVVYHKDEILTYRPLIFISYLYSLGVIITRNSPNLIEKAIVRPWGFTLEAGILYYLFSMILMLNLLIGSLILYKKYKAIENTLIKNKFKYIFIAIVSGAIGGILNVLVNLGLNIPPIGNLGATLFLLFISYGVLKHNVMGIDIFVTKSLILSLTTIIAALVFAVLSESFEFLIEQNIFQVSNIYSRMISAFIVGLLFDPIKTKSSSLISYLLSKSNKHTQSMATLVSEVYDN